MKTLVIDTSVVLAFYLPAEPYKARALALLADYAAGAVRLVTPTLTYYEVLNVLSRALPGLKRGQTMSHDEASAVLRAWVHLKLEERSVQGLEQHIVQIAEGHQRSGYDAAYLALAEHLGADLITGDERFYNTMSGDFPQLQFIANYVPSSFPNLRLT
jgi:predicted nucleic acid-binding protein